MRIDRYTTTPQIVYEFDGEDDAWFGYLQWNGPDGQSHCVSLAMLEDSGADKAGP